MSISFFLLYLHQRDQCNYGDISTYAWQYIYICLAIYLHMPVCFLPSDFYFMFLYYNGRKQTLCFMFGGNVHQEQCCCLHCVDCGQVFRVQIMSDMYNLLCRLKRQPNIKYYNELLRCAICLTEVRLRNVSQN